MKIHSPCFSSTSASDSTTKVTSSTTTTAATTTTSSQQPSTTTTVTKPTGSISEGFHGIDRMVVGFINIYAINAYHH
jgi:hypothetical protein